MNRKLFTSGLIVGLVVGIILSAQLFALKNKIDKLDKPFTRGDMQAEDVIFRQNMREQFERLEDQAGSMRVARKKDDHSRG